MTTDPPMEVELLRWWHQYQARRLNQTADLIRNGILQDLLAVRRQLESTCHAPKAEASGCAYRVADLECIYAQLEDLSNQLDAPFLQDSLPLALQHQVQPWQQKLNLELHLPPRWDAEPVEQTRLLMIWLETLLGQLDASAQLPRQCAIDLRHHVNHKELWLQATYEALPPTEFITQLSSSSTPFLKTFRLFTQGQYQQLIQAQSLVWKLRWSGPSDL